MRKSLCLLLIVVLLFATLSRNRVWLDPLTLWADVISKGPSKQRGYLNLGISLMELKRYRESVDALRRAIELNPYSHLALLASYNLGRVYLNEQRYDEAISILNRVIESDSSYEKAYVGRAVAYIEKGQLDMAERDLLSALSLNPLDANIYYNMGRIYLERGMPQEAIKAYSEAIRLKPEFAHAYNNRGVVYAELGRLEYAYRDFKEAVRLRPDFHEALVNLERIKGSLLSPSREIQ